MENYSYNSYPESGNSSPRSREIDFENPPPWEDNQSQNPLNYKAKFMCSYGGKIQPRPHDNQLSYIGGETKIFSVDRNIKFASMISKVAALCGGDSEVSFKYQLPGEELDALISVSNDDDLEHMMHEYDRLYRPSAKPARMRLFIFPASGPSTSFSSDAGKSDRERFVEALNSGSGLGAEKNAGVPPNKVDFLFGIEKGMAPPLPVKIQNIVPPESVAPPLPPPQIPEVVGSDPVANHVEMQRHLQELQRLQIQDQEEQYRKKIDDQNNSVPYAAGGYYPQKLPEQAPPVTLPVSVQQSAHPGYWPEKQISGAGYPANLTNAPVQTHPSEHRVYMVPAPPAGTFYHAPSPISATAPPPAQPQQMVRSVTGQGGQGGYYTNVQRMPAEMYREHAVTVYNMATAAAPTMSHPPPISAVQQQVAQTGGLTEQAYAQVPGYDRQVYYTGPGAGGMMLPPHYQGVGVAVSGEMNAAVADRKVAPKVSQASI